MTLEEYARLDALGLAARIAAGDLTAREAAALAARAIAAVEPALGAVIETYADRIEGLDETTLGPGPFRGVPFLIKDVGGHEKGRKIEFGSRLCEGMTADVDTHFAELLRASGVNILGRSNTPEFSISGCSSNALYGRTSTPWRLGYSAAGSTGGGAAAVAAGVVPIAHGSDISGSIRMPAALCGGVGLKPSRGRVSVGPGRDEGGWGLAAQFVQTKSIRDTAAMLDCLAIPQPGDPFVIPRPAEPYATLAARAPGPLRIALTTTPLMDAAVDPEIVAATRATARTLEDLGHRVHEVAPDFDGPQTMLRLLDVWFFGFDLVLEGHARRTGRTLGPHTLEPITLRILEHARALSPARFFDAHGHLNTARRRLARSLWAEADLWLTPTCARVSEPHGIYDQARADLDLVAWLLLGERAIHYQFPYNLMGAPAISLPLAMHSSGLPIGVQLGGPPASEHLVLQVAAQLEAATPWADRLPPIHASRG